MIRFSAFLVVVAVGLLVAGVVTSKLLLVYIAIGVSGVALLALGIGAAVNWRELTGKSKTAAETGAQGPAPAQQVAAQQADRDDNEKRTEANHSRSLRGPRSGSSFAYRRSREGAPSLVRKPPECCTTSGTPYWPGP